MNSSKVRVSIVVFALGIRTILFTLGALLLVTYFRIQGVQQPWDEASKWWIFQAIFAGFITFYFLQWILKRENIKYTQFIAFKKERWVKDIGLALLCGVLGLIVGGVGIYGTGFIIFGGLPPETMFQPLPLWAVIIGLLFMPLSIAAVEAPLYIGYALPRLELLLKNKWSAILIASFCLAFQHIALPLVFDWQFMLWRVVAFLPVAILLALIFLKTKRLFPLMIAHFLMDLQIVLTILFVSI